MNVVISNIIDTVFREVNEYNGVEGSDGINGAVSRQDMLSYFNISRRKINRKVNNLKADSRLQGVINKIMYEYPFDFKSNMYRIEYDGKPLIKSTLTTLDQYDADWRNSNDRTPPDNSPIYYVLDEPNRKFLVYPPPPETGVKYDLTTEDGIAEAIAASDFTEEDGIPEGFNLEGEFIDLTDEDGIPEIIIGQKNNLKIFYYKHLTDTTNEQDILEAELESQQEAIKYFMKGLIYTSEHKQNLELSAVNFELYNDETGDIEDEKQHLRPTMAFSVRRNVGRQWGRWGRRLDSRRR